MLVIVNHLFFQRVSDFPALYKIFVGLTEVEGILLLQIVSMNFEEVKWRNLEEPLEKILNTIFHRKMFDLCNQNRLLFSSALFEI